VVGLGVGEHQHVQALDPGVREPPHDRPTRRTGVEQHRDPVALEQDRVPLAHIEERDEQLAGPQRRWVLAQRVHADGHRRDRRDDHEDPGADADRAAPCEAPQPPTWRAAQPRRRSGRGAEPGDREPAPQADHRQGDGDRYRIGSSKAGGAAQPDRHRRERSPRRRVGDPFEVPQQWRAYHVQRQREGGRHLRDRHAEHPQPHDRGDHRGREQVRGQRGERHLLEVQRAEWRRRQRRGDGDRRHVRHGLRHAPVRERRPQPRREGEQPDHGRERQLPARVAGGEGVERERHRRREAERVPARRGTSRHRRDEAGDAHDACALDRRAGAGQRDVEDDESRRDDQPPAQGDVDHRAERQRQRAEEQHVLPAHREQVREP
jgi:hypothetical protein